MAGMEIMSMRHGREPALFLSTSTAITDPLSRQLSSIIVHSFGSEFLVSSFEFQVV